MHADLVSTDPLAEALAAQRDGLLTYRGFVSGGRFEVESGGRRWTMTGPHLLEQIARLRAIARLADMGGTAQLLELRDDGTHVFRVARRTVELPALDVVPWYRGFAAAHAGNGQPHTGPNTIGVIQDLFQRTSVGDQRKMVILGLMYGRPGEPEITADGLAAMIGELPDVESRPVKKTVLNAIAFGKPLSKKSKLADQALAVFGLRWADPETADVVRLDGTAVDGPLPQMPSLVCLRGFVAASRRSLLRYCDQELPNEARWLSRFSVTVGQQRHVVPVDGGPAWLDGLNGFHGVVRRGRGRA